MFSIVIPVFNNAGFVAESITRLEQQLRSSPESEIIVVDDASTDDSLSILTELAEKLPALTVLQSNSNKGPGSARNIGIQAAQNEWVLFLDCDDRLVDGALKELDHQITSHPTLDFICFDWRYDKNPTSGIHGYQGRDDLERIATGDKKSHLKAYLQNKIDNSVIYCAFRKSFLNDYKIAFREGYHEDVDFLFSCFLYAEYVGVLHKVLYLKNNRAGSIVNTFTLKHINGYYLALNSIASLLKSSDYWADYQSTLLKMVQDVTASRIMRLQRQNWQEADSLLPSLFSHVISAAALIESKLDFSNPKEKFKTKYQMVFDFFIQHFSDHEAELSTFIGFVEEIKDKSWSCYDIQNSVFLAPDEIRTCCKRYFHNGEMKGDVVLIDHNNSRQFPNVSYDEIVEKKSQLHKDINRDSAPQCAGCPFLYFEDWNKPLSNGIKYFSLEYHSVCNMKCTYCSDTYYGGKKAEYDVETVVDSMIESNALDNAEYIVWGGGEPILDKAFPSILTKLSNSVSDVKQRIITNATRFSEPLGELLKRDKAFIVTSIDAGTEQTFNQVRQYSRMHKVMSVLKKYADISPENVIVKYILLDSNQDIAELRAFISLIKEYQLEKCNFQISYDFTSEALVLRDVESAVFLYASLEQLGVRFTFIDDLLMQRVRSLSPGDWSILKQNIKEKGIELAQIAPEAQSITEVAVWGTGEQAKVLHKKTAFFRDVDVAYYVDPRPEMIGRTFMGKTIFSPEKLIDSDLPVVISAVQSAPHIYSQFLAMELNTKRLVRQLII